jgi:HlyD family secretion protein
VRSNLRRLFYLLLAGGLIALLVYGFLPKPVDVDVSPVTRGPLLVTVDEDGKTRIREKYIVSAPLNGRLRRVEMDPGDSVYAGETLVVTIEPVDPQLLDSRSLAEAEARVKAAEVALKKADPVLEQARVSLEHAETELARKRKLSETNAMAQAELQDAEFAYRSKVEEFRSVRFAQEIAAYELQQAQAALLRSRPREVSDEADAWQFEIKSPITGKVLRVFQESSAVVTPGTPLVELGDGRDLEIEIDVLSADAVAIRPGQRVIIEHWGGPEPLSGRVRLVEPSAFTKISALGVEEQRVWVIVDIVDPPEKRETLGDAFRIESRIVVAEAENALQIPTSARFRDAQQNWSVYQVVEQRAEMIPITIGLNNGLQTEILAGLRENDIVIVHPSDQIRDGTKVRRRNGAKTKH